MDNWDALRLILAIDRNGGLSSAARALGINHATASRRLSRFEDSIGQRIFERLHNGLLATPTGKTVLSHAKRVEEQMAALDLDLAADDDEAGVLLVTTPPLLMTQPLARDFYDFKKANPRIELRISGEDRIANLHMREADIAIRISRSPAESLWGRKVARQNSGYYASAKCIQKLRAQPHKPIPIVAFSAWETIVPNDFKKQFPLFEVVATCDDMVAAIALVRAGMGVTRMPCFLGHSVPGLTLLPDQQLRPYSPIWILTHPTLKGTPRVMNFISFMGKRFTERSALYLGSK